MLTVRLGGMELPYDEPWCTVTVPVYVPLHWAAVSVWQDAVTVTVKKLGPHDIPLLGFAVSIILLLLTLVVRTTFVTGGAHLKESPMLPELPMLTELNLMLTGFADQRTFGEELDARTEE